MPFAEEQVRLGPITALPVERAVERPGALNTLAAAFRQSNIVSSLYDRASEPALSEPQSAEYDPLGEIDGFEQFATRFLHSRSSAETARIKGRIQAELADRDTLARAGGWGMAASVAAGVVDPATLASMAIPATAPTRAGMLVRLIGTQVAADTASEMALHQMQETRTVGESVFNVGAGTLLTGILGTIATRIPKAELEAMRRQLGEELNAPFTGPLPETSTGGAARVGHGTTLEDETIARGGQTLAATVGRLSPVTRLLQSATREARVLAQELVDVPYLLAKNLRGIATPTSVESRVKQLLTRRRVETVNTLEDAFKQYRAGGGKLTLRQFGEEVSAAMTRGDVHEIGQVASVARSTRKLFAEDLKTLQELGALPEEIEVLGAKSYFPRVYDHAAIAANRADFESRLRRWFTANPKRDEAGNLVQREAGEIEASVQATVDRIMGTVRGMADVGSAKPSPLKARVLDVPDEVLAPYLVRDFEHVLQGYLRATVPQIEMRRSFGSTTLESEVQAITDKYHAMQARTTDNALKERLRSQHAKDITDVLALRDRVLGQVGPRGNDSLHFVRALRLARAYNYVRLLGGQTLSSLPDFGRVISRYGLLRTGRATAKFLTNLRANKLAREDAKRMGTALEWTLDTRGSTLADIGDELAGSRLERIAQWGTQKFSRVSLMATWNSSLKAIASVLEQEAIIRAVRTANVGSYGRAKLASIGIGDDELKRIATQLGKFADDSEGLARARTELWDDQEAAKLFENAIVNAADQVVLTRGAGDLPLFMDKEIAKTLAQFKSFGMAAVNRTLIPLAQGLARGDVATANGLVAMLGLGALSHYLKEVAAGREPDLAPERVVAEALNWSGLLAYLPDLYDPVAGMLHAPRLSRYQSRSPFESLSGPTFGTAEDVYRGIEGMTDLGVTEKDIHRVRKLLPLQNLFYLRRVIDALEEGTAEAVGATDEPPR